MTIHPRARTRELIEQQMRARGYESPEAVIDAAVARLAQDDPEISAELLNRLIAEGVAQLDQGQGIPADEAFEQAKLAITPARDTRP
jgi:hypothetical protein